MDEVLYERRGHVAILTLNRPERLNAMTLGSERLESAYLQQFRDDPEAWVLVYRGEGRAFCTGLDLAQAQEIISAEHRPPTLAGAEPLKLWKPVIAAIQGYAVGGGFEIALACDIRLAAEDARFGLPEVKRGLIPGMGGIQRLSRAVPPGEALYYLLTGELLDAVEAYRLGLVHRVVPAEQLLGEAMRVAELIAENSPTAVRNTKEAAVRGVQLSLWEALVQDKLIALRNRLSDDAREGPRAFVEKRKPVWKV